MIATSSPMGLPLPSANPTVGPQVAQVSTPQVVSLGGLVNVGNAAAALAMGVPPTAQEQQDLPVIQGLAAHIRDVFRRAAEARQSVEQRMIEAMLARRGQYTPDKLKVIESQRQPAIYMMVASAKMRQVEALLRDVLIGAGTDKPWTIRNTPVPDLPPELVEQLVQQLIQEIQQAVVAGFPPSMDAARQRLRQMRDEMMPRLQEEAAKRAARMEEKMEDQLVEGGLLTALDEFITDVATFPSAFIEGPIVRRKPTMSWGDGGALVVENKIVLEWERRDPFDVYPVPEASNVTRDDLVIKRRLTRGQLNELIGVEGYSEAAIRQVLEQFDSRGFREYTAVDTQKADAEGKSTTNQNLMGTIDALRYFGSASGRMLREWGLSARQVPDLDKEYQIEAWLVGHIVIKAMLNADPLARRPLYGASFQSVPGSPWGMSPYDLMRDCQDMCNAAARSLAANLGISSGPQVSVISNRIPSGEDVTEMFPWKIWQFESDPMGSTAAPIQFFQPQSNAQELMTVYERFSAMADEYTGIPRYMAGFNGGEGGAGRTASGISMMIGNASKVIKQVLGTVDVYIITPLLERLYYYNMRYGDDPELKGDVKIVARGALSLTTKEAAQMRTNEFLQATGNPIDMQIIGLEGRAELLRQSVRRLDLNGDKVVPPDSVLRQRTAMQQAQMAMAAMGPQGTAQGQTPAPASNGETLQDGTPTTDNFSPQGA